MISFTQKSIASVERVQKQLVLASVFLVFQGRSLKNMDDYWQERVVSKENVMPCLYSRVMSIKQSTSQEASPFIWHETLVTSWSFMEAVSMHLYRKN